MADRQIGLRTRPVLQPITGMKRKAMGEPAHHPAKGKKAATTKRSAFGDITNALVEKSSLKSQVKKGLTNIVSKTRSTSSGSKSKAKSSGSERSSESSISASSSSDLSSFIDSTLNLPCSSQEIIITHVPEVEESIVADESVNLPVPSCPPPGVCDYDQEVINDPNQVGEYAMEIFAYYKSREKTFSVPDYMRNQLEVTENMRAILIDWLVEVQESFELNHETLYTAAKLVDLYLSQRTRVAKETLQKIGAVAYMIACKVDERIPPMLDDFVYVCDDAYRRDELIEMERDMIDATGYDFGFPLSYRFLRRYGRVCKVTMPVLTLARYILETSLLEYRFNIQTSESQMATASLILAFKIRGIEGWEDTLEYYSGYKAKDVKHLVKRLHAMIRRPVIDSLRTIYQKYSHSVFHRVAHTEIPAEIDLDD